MKRLVGLSVLRRRKTRCAYRRHVILFTGMDGKTVRHNVSNNIFAYSYLNFRIHITSLNIRPNQSTLVPQQVYLRCRIMRP